MLILRVAEGTAWQKDAMKPRTSIVVFKPGGDTSYSSGSDGSGVVRKHAEPTFQGESSKGSEKCESPDQSLGTTAAETGSPSRSLDSKM